MKRDNDNNNNNHNCAIRRQTTIAVSLWHQCCWHVKYCKWHLCAIYWRVSWQATRGMVTGMPCTLTARLYFRATYFVVFFFFLDKNIYLFYFKWRECIAVNVPTAKCIHIYITADTNNAKLLLFLNGHYVDGKYRFWRQYAYIKATILF